MKPSSAHAKKNLNFNITSLFFAGVSTVALAWLLLLGWFLIIAFQKDLSIAIEQAQQQLEQQKRFATTISGGWLGTPNEMLNRGEQIGERLAQQILGPQWLAQAAEQLKTSIYILPSEQKGFSSILDGLKFKAIQVVKVIITINELILLKIIQLLCAVPLFILAGLIGLSEGLLKRDLRKVQAGRESAFLFHKVYVWGFRLMLAGLLAFLLTTIRITPQIQLCFLAGLFCVWIYQTAARFKKYV